MLIIYERKTGYFYIYLAVVQSKATYHRKLLILPGVKFLIRIDEYLWGFQFTSEIKLIFRKQVQLLLLQNFNKLL